MIHLCVYINTHTHIHESLPSGSASRAQAEISQLSPSEIAVFAAAAARFEMRETRIMLCHVDTHHHIPSLYTYDVTFTRNDNTNDNDNLCACVYLHPSIYLSIHPSIYNDHYVCVCMYVCVYVYVCIHMYI